MVPSRGLTKRETAHPSAWALLPRSRFEVTEPLAKVPCRGGESPHLIPHRTSPAGSRNAHRRYPTLHRSRLHTNRHEDSLSRLHDIQHERARCSRDGVPTRTGPLSLKLPPVDQLFPWPYQSHRTAVNKADIPGPEPSVFHLPCITFSFFPRPYSRRNYCLS